MPLQAGLQLVVQYRSARGGPTCRGFTGLPTTNSAWILVEPIHPTSVPAAEALGRAIADAALRLGPNAQEVGTPCGGHGFGNCHAASEPECVKLKLVVVEQPLAKSTLHKITTLWSANGPSFVELPVIVGSTPASVLPPAMAHLNALRWTYHDKVGPLDILRKAGITSERRRVFISYVRADCDRLAEQLFDGLSKRGFAVFLDRFRLEPGSDFQVRLNEELGHMGTILVLESKRLRQSLWVRHEVNFARKHGLAMLALTLPGGHKVSGVSASCRKLVDAKDFKKSVAELKVGPLAKVLAEVEEAHARADAARSAYMRDNISRTLAQQGWMTQGFDTSGNILARRRRGEHAFRVCSLPAELADFRSIDFYRPGLRGLAVVAPGRFMSWRTREPLDWLSQSLGTELVDPADFRGFLSTLP